MFAIFGLLFILLISFITLIFYIIFKKKIILQIIGAFWISIIAFFILGSIYNFLNSKKNISMKDIYGEYIIDREKYSGKYSDWQYNHYKFEITKNDEFIFYNLNNQGRVINENKGKIQIVKGYASPRIRIIQLEKEDQLIEKEPTLYREIWNFYYVFKTKKSGNMFYKKGKWKHLD